MNSPPRMSDLITQPTLSLLFHVCNFRLDRKHCTDRLTPDPLTGWMTRLLPPPLPAGLPLPAPPFESMTMVRVEPLPPRPDPGGRPLPRPRPPRVGDD